MGSVGIKKPQSTGKKSRASASVDITQSGWEWNPNDNNPSGSRHRRMQAELYSQFANIADFPDMPNFDNLGINFPDIKMPKIEIPHIKIPKIKIPEIKIHISPEDIASNKGSGYSGVSMVTINGETVVTMNEGGNVKTFKVPAGSSKEKTILAETVVNN